MRSREIVVRFLKDICAAFPEIQPLMRRHPAYMPTSKMGEFASATTKAFEVGHVERAVHYLNFMSNRLDPRNAIEFEYIDVYYVENLFFPKGTEAARVGWPLVPENLKSLYLKFHGKPPL